MARSKVMSLIRLRPRGSGGAVLSQTGTLTLAEGFSGVAFTMIVDDPDYDTYTEISDPDGIATNVGNIDQVTISGLNYEAATTHTLRYGASASLVPAKPTIYKNFVITVTNVAPVLSNATDTKTGITTASITVDTTEGAGTLYSVVTGSVTNPTAVQIKAGLDHLGAPAVFSNNVGVASTGTKTVSVTGLTGSTTYYAHFVQTDGGGANSNVIAGDGFTTDSAATLLLDAIGSLGPVYSFRKLVTAYAGNCATLHESGGNTDQTFGFVSNVIDPASATFGTGTRTVKTWFDQSGNGIDITNATVAQQPLFIASGINSLPTARFDGVNDALSKASVARSSLANSNEMTFLFAQKQTGVGATTVTMVWIDPGDATRINVHAPYSLTMYFDFGDTTNGRVSASQPGGWDSTPHITEGYRTTGGTQELLVDGASLVSAACTTGPTGTGAATWNIGGNGAQFLGGDLSELIVLKNDTGGTNRATIRKNGVGTGVKQGMGAYYGITVA